MASKATILDSLLSEHGLDINTVNDAEMNSILMELTEKELMRLGQDYMGEDFKPDVIANDLVGDIPDEWSSETFDNPYDTLIEGLIGDVNYAQNIMEEGTESFLVNATMPEFVYMQAEKRLIDAKQKLYDVGYGLVKDKEGQWKITGLNHPTMSDYERPETKSDWEQIWEANYMGWVYDSGMWAGDKIGDAWNWWLRESERKADPSKFDPRIVNRPSGISGVEPGSRGSTPMPPGMTDTRPRQ